jgi:carboxymethylenebutenolidase
MIPGDQRATIGKALEAGNVRHELVTYPGAGHAFMRSVDPKAHRPEAARDAWEKTKRLFAEELR